MTFSRQLLDLRPADLKTLTFIFLVLATAAATGLADVSDEDPLPSGEDAQVLLRRARSVLPRETVELIGDLLVRRPRGLVSRQYGFAIRLEYGATPPGAEFTIYSDEGDFLHHLRVDRGAELQVSFFDQEGETLSLAPALTDSIGVSDLTWLDLTLDYLWWPDPRMAGEDRVRGRDCFVVEVAPPESIAPANGVVRLWLDRETGMLLRAEQVDREGRVRRSMWVRSVRKHGERWMIRDLEVDAAGSGHRTRMHVVDFSVEP